MKLFKFVALYIFFLSCNDRNSNVKNTETDPINTAATTSTKTNTADSTYEIAKKNIYYIWDVDEQKKTVRKNPALASMNLNVDSVINGLNIQYENILLEKTAVEKGTIHLRIRNSDFLTNQMGSSGPEQYIAQTVINLTAVPGIRFVHIDFAEGSHASPGTWSRKDFPGYIIIQ